MKVGATFLVGVIALLAASSSVAAAPEQIVVSFAGTVEGASGRVQLGGAVRGDAASLSGTAGTAHVSFASPATFELHGALDGTVAMLQGTVAHAAAQFLVGTPVLLTADSATGTLHLEFGPIPPGAPPPLVGVTLIFDGTGRVRVAGD